MIVVANRGVMSARIGWTVHLYEHSTSNGISRALDFGLWGLADVTYRDGSTQQHRGTAGYIAPGSVSPTNDPNTRR